MKKILFIGIFIVVFGFSPIAKAELINNGGGLIYDTELNVTWYDFNPGRMTWSESVAWAAGLDVGNVTGWRLPKILPVNGSSYNWSYSYNGSTDIAHNISASDSAYPGTKASEMAYLHYTSLGNKGLYAVNGTYQPDLSGLKNNGPFMNLEDSWYWSGTVYGPNSASACYFGFVHGLQWAGPKESETRYAIAVHDGNILNPVPIPSAILLFAPSLFGLVVLRRRFKK